MTAAKRKMEMRLEYSFMSLHQFMESNFFFENATHYKNQQYAKPTYDLTASVLK